MKTTNPDLQFINEALPQLQEYLLSNELYWPLSGNLPRLTPGSLLLSLARLGVTAPQESPALAAQVDAVRGRWLSSWEKKAAREITNRTRLWSQYLSDNLGAQDESFDSYRSEVRGRVILQLLLQVVPSAPERSALVELDRALRSRLVSRDFIWEPQFQNLFPRDDYWFLYGSI